MIDVQRLETFIFAAEYLSFSEAAKQLNLTQPTVSYHIKALEKELGVELFIWSGGSHLHMTEAARMLLPWARRLLNQSNEIQEMVASFQEGVVGQLRFACSTTAGKYILPQLAARFRRRYPGIRVSIMRCVSGGVTDILLNNEANLGVVSFEVDDSHIERQEFFNDSITLIAPKNHPWVDRKSIEPEEIINEPLIIREPTSGTRKVMLTELAKYDISLDDLNIFMELGNAEAIVRTVAAGYGISFVSTLATAFPLELGQVVKVQISGMNLRRKIFMIRKRLEEPHRPQEVFWSFIRNPDNADLLRMAEGNPL
jgi:DNA-binding transcriptional LysR family regulator